MVTFILKQGKKEIKFGQLHRPLKQKAEALRLQIEEQLRSLECPVHHLGPVVLLHAEKNDIVLTGIGGCCKEFVSTIGKTIDLPGLSPDDIVVTKTMSYIHEE